MSTATATTTIQKWGNSQGIRLPKVILEGLLLKENDEVDIAIENEAIIIKKSTRKRRANKSLEERFDSYVGEYKCSEFDWGMRTGEEYW